MTKIESQFLCKITFKMALTNIYIKLFLGGGVPDALSLSLSHAPSLSLCPFPPPGCFITADFSSQSGKVHLQEEV